MLRIFSPNLCNVFSKHTRRFQHNKWMLKLYIQISFKIHPAIQIIVNKICTLKSPPLGFSPPQLWTSPPQKRPSTPRGRRTPWKQGRFPDWGRRKVVFNWRPPLPPAPPSLPLLWTPPPRFSDWTGGEVAFTGGPLSW